MVGFMAVSLVTRLPLSRPLRPALAITILQPRLRIRGRSIAKLMVASSPIIANAKPCAKASRRDSTDPHGRLISYAHVIRMNVISVTYVWEATPPASVMAQGLGSVVVVVAVVALTVDEDPNADVVLAVAVDEAIALLGGCWGEMTLTTMAGAIKTPLHPALLAWGCMLRAALGGWSMKGASSAYSPQRSHRLRRGHGHRKKT